MTLFSEVVGSSTLLSSRTGVIGGVLGIATLPCWRFFLVAGFDAGIDAGVGTSDAFSLLDLISGQGEGGKGVAAGRTGVLAGSLRLNEVDTAVARCPIY